MDAHYYRVDLAWHRDRRGMLCSPELKTPAPSNGCIEVATPPEFPKGVAGIWSPEHLFTAAISSCLMTTFLAVAENSRLDFVSFECAAKGKLDKQDNQWRMTEVLLEPVVKIRDEKDQERALKVLQKAEAACLITKSVRAQVTMIPHIEVVTESTLSEPADQG